MPGQSQNPVSPRDEALRKYPDFPWLSAGDVEGLDRVLRGLGWLEVSERVERAERAGDGNMNLTLRIETGARTFILKQARPWVEKYPELAAPWERSRVEQAFYIRAAQTRGVGEAMPQLIATDDAARLLALEDLPGARDLSDLYSVPPPEPLTSGEIRSLAHYLAHLHASSDDSPDSRFENRSMRELNHAHIYAIPLDRDNGLDLDPHEAGLGTAAEKLMDDSEFRALVRAQGLRYLSEGKTLLHGDYFPGSWLRTDLGLRIIDPEFTFYGDAEFDLGCAVAHFALAQLPAEVAAEFLDLYAKDPILVASQTRPSEVEVARNAGIEVMRRLIGVAQLNLAPSEGWRADLLERARNAALAGDYRRLFS